MFVCVWAILGPVLAPSCCTGTSLMVCIYKSCFWLESSSAAPFSMSQLQPRSLSRAQQVLHLAHFLHMISLHLNNGGKAFSKVPTIHCLHLLLCSDQPNHISHHFIENSGTDGATPAAPSATTDGACAACCGWGKGNQMD